MKISHFPRNILLQRYEIKLAYRFKLIIGIGKVKEQPSRIISTEEMREFQQTIAKKKIIA